MSKNISDETRKKMSESAKKRCTKEWLEKQHARATKLPVEEIRSLYESGKTQLEIGNIFGVSQKVIWRCMKNNGIKSRSTAKRNQYGENNTSWVGGVVTSDCGYVLERREGHQRSKKCGHYVPQHVLVVEDFLGITIPHNMSVHHINKDKTDNRPENLALLSKTEHSKYHSQMRYHGFSDITPIPITELKGDCI